MNLRTRLQYLLILCCLCSWLFSEHVAPLCAPAALADDGPTAVTVTFRQGIDGYHGWEDTRITEENPNTNFGADRHIAFGMRGRASILVRTDVSSIPANATIQEARLYYFVDNWGPRSNVPIIAGAYLIIRSWNIMEATWMRATSMAAWGIPGCKDPLSDHAPTPLDTDEMFDRWVWKSWDVATAVQEWVRNPASNLGVVVAQVNSEVAGEYDIRGAEYMDPLYRPYLVVMYTLATATPVASATATATATATGTATPTTTSTSTATPLPTPTASVTQTPLPTLTPTATRTPRPGQFKAYIPGVQKNYPLSCLHTDYIFNDDFIDPGLAGWRTSLDVGHCVIDDSMVHLWTIQYVDRFPIIWHNTLFDGAGDEYTVEMRFRYSHMTAYGTTIAINSQPYTRARRIAALPIPEGTEDILSIHHVVDPTSGVFRYDATVGGETIAWHESPGDTEWHTAALERRVGGVYTLYVDGRLVTAVQSDLLPSSMFIGNPTIQPFDGPWTHVYVDYVRIRKCVQWGAPAP